MSSKKQKKNELISKKHKKVCKILNYIERLLIFASRVTGCISIPACTSLVGILIGTKISASAVKVCARTAVIKKYKSKIKKEKEHGNVVLLVKTKLNSVEVLISKALFDSNISHDKLVLINNVVKEYYEMNKKIKRSNDIK